MMAKKKKELKPEIKDYSDIGLKDEYEEVLNTNQDVYLESHDQENGDSFFKHALKQLFDIENVSTKTEYLNPRENFYGAKATFFGRHCDVPFLDEFIKVFEEKRISLERKGRKEIIIGIQERRQELERERLKNFEGVLGL